MAKIHIEIRDDISPSVAVECVNQVIMGGKVSNDTKGNAYYCWATCFTTMEGNLIVSVRPYRKSDCFVVYKDKR